MSRPFHLAPELFEALATGHGGPAAVAQLRRQKLNDNLLLLRHLVLTNGDNAMLRNGLEVLSKAQLRKPEVVADLLSHPWSGAWLSAASRRQPGNLPSVDASRLTTVAAVACARTGGRALLPFPGSASEIMLPDVGSATVVPSGSTEIVVKDGHVEIGGGPRRISASVGEGKAMPGWRPLRRLNAVCDGQRFMVTLDDLDPLRDCHQHPVAPRLSAEEFERWTELHRDAWTLIVRYAPGWAAELAEGISVLVPLSRESTRTGFSATSSDVFGGFALTRSVNAAMLATTLVHELQHSKLNALRPHRLCHPTPDTQFFVPWRDDPRPVNGMLHGLYAFTGVADMWRQLRAVPGLEDSATIQFVRLREQLWSALATTGQSDLLTPDGEVFVAALRDTVANMRRVSVPSRILYRARAALRMNRVAWSIRNRSIRNTVRLRADRDHIGGGSISKSARRS